MSRCNAQVDGGAKAVSPGSLRLGWLLALILALNCLSAFADDDPIAFGVIATERSGAMRQMWEPFLADMSHAIGRKVVGYYATDYAAIVEAQRFRKVQLAWYGNRAAINAVDRANGEVFAQFVDADGTQGYYGYVICRKDAPFATLDDLLRDGRRYSFGVGDPDSYSGTLVQNAELFLKRGLDVRTTFRVVRSSNHEGNFLAVLNGQIDAATSNSEMLTKIRDTAPEKFERVRILWQSPLLPRDPLVWDRELPADLKNRIRDFVLNYGKTEREKRILHDMYHLAGFRASSNAQLQPVRDLIATLERHRNDPR